MLNRSFNSYEIKGNQLVLHASHCMEHARKTSYLPKQHIILIEDGRNFNIYMFCIGMFCVFFGFFAKERDDVIITVSFWGWMLMVNAIYLYYGANVSIYTAATRHRLNCCSSDIGPLITWFKSDSPLTEVLMQNESSM